MATNRMGPPCPACNCLSTDIDRTARSADGGFYRNRVCASCNHTFSTIQPPEVPVQSGKVRYRGRVVQIDWRLFRLPTPFQA
jgi:hypothetical protein